MATVTCPYCHANVDLSELNVAEAEHHWHVAHCHGCDTEFAYDEEDVHEPVLVAG